MSIETNVATPHDLFERMVIYEIPPFQRSYVWREEQQWQPLWDDVLTLVEEWGDMLVSGPPTDEANRPSHFLGAMVLKQQPRLPGNTPLYSVIDGQQRLTTLQLLLNATCGIFAERNLAAEDDLRKLVQNSNRQAIETGEGLLKIEPAQVDRAAFVSVMTDASDRVALEKSAIATAHAFFKSRINAWLDQAPESMHSKASMLSDVLGHLMKIVVIQVGSRDDSQIIFETLNARGTPLLQSDLARNYLIHNSGSDHDVQQSFADSHFEWLKDTWFRKEVKQGSIHHPRVDQFLHYWTTMSVARVIPIGDTFSEFRRHVEASPTVTVTEIADALKEAAVIYRQMEKPPFESPIRVFLERYQALQAGVLTPLLLWLQVNAPSNGDDNLLRAVRAIESYLFRRALFNRQTQGLNKMIPNILGNLDAEDEYGMSVESVIRALATQEGTLAWPTDKDVFKLLQSTSVYDSMTSKKLTLVLEALDAEIATKYDEKPSITVGKRLTVEHIMPQNWDNGHWPLQGNQDRQTRDNLIHTIGNLTLLTGSRNSSLADKPWSEKAKALQKKSSLSINRELFENYKTWDDEQIIERSKLLADRVVRLWPGPDSA